MYVGRIVVVGKYDRPFVAYRVSSRSFPNRVARITDVGVAIQPLDEDDVRRNPYIAYNCIRISSNGVVVSNGSHTDPIYDKLEQGIDPHDALRQVLTEMGYEKDDFNTPRIAGIVTNDIGYIGTARVDAIEVGSFTLKENSCCFICTCEKGMVDLTGYPFIAETSLDASKYVVDGGIFTDFELPVCAAAWMGDLAVFNPNE
ncbi:MAG: IMP cyclohydrolase [Armatimonadota bacterium]